VTILFLLEQLVLLTANAGSMENRFEFDLATVNIDTKDFLSGKRLST
jgi:hypothetical protein